jgi:3'-5' exoribonuclease
MPKIFVDTLELGMELDDSFLVAQKQIAKRSNGRDFLRLTLADRTGRVNAVMWDVTEDIANSFTKDDIIRVKATVREYQDALQLNIQKITKARDADLVDFLPEAANRAEHQAELRELIASIKHPQLHKLLIAVFETEPMKSGFPLAPAGKTMHHSYLGGLLEHTVSMAKICEFLASHYSGLDRDMLVAGALLHDIGKVREYAYQRSFDYTTEGRLVGHIVIGMGILDKAIREVLNFPGDLALRLRHMLLSHHGEREYGAPVVPMTIEALALHFADDLDSKLNGYATWLKENPAADNTGWSEFHKLFGRYLYEPPK